MFAELCGVAMCLVYGGFLVLARFVFLVVFWEGICLLGNTQISCKKNTRLKNRVSVSLNL